MGTLRQYTRQDAKPSGWGFLDALLWYGVLWLHRENLIELELKGLQPRGGFSNGDD